MRGRALRLALGLLGPLLLAMLAACMQTTQNATVAAADGQQAPVAALASAEPNSGDYRIAPRDILEVSVFQVADLNKTVQVSDDGKITLPLIGVVAIKGKTPQEASDFIAAQLGKKYLQSPQVSVFVKQYGQKVTVNGEVKSPRVLNVEGSLTLTQAIAYAGGLGDLADTKRIHVARSSGGRVQDTIYDINQIQSGQTPDPSLQGGDLVVAEQSGMQVAIKNVKDMLPFAVLASVL